jgi:hypothetical protein
MSKVEAEDLSLLYDLVWGQFKEDREAVMAQHKDLKAYIAANQERYAISGDTLAKFAELMVKQTAQIIELIKIAKKESGDSELTLDDYKRISKAIEAESEEEERDVTANEVVQELRRVRDDLPEEEE